MKISHLDLFSGIGGFALATEMVWLDVEHTFCDNEPYAQAVLNKHWPQSEIYADIRELTADSYHAQRKSPQLLQQRGLGDRGRREGIDLLTGGFPCQPFSQAGRRRGAEDDRFLWPEMLRVIREFKPRWVIGENVAGIISMALDQVCIDLENEGYEVQPFVIPASALNAPHRRDRVWIVAHAKSERRRGESEALCGKERRQDDERLSKRKHADSASKNPEHQPARHQKRGRNDQRAPTGITRPDWNESWVEVATRLCRMDDGIPRRLDRNPRLKALGNAIVPQVAAQIMQAIKEIDERV